ncbi:MAG TPA: protein arginine kinase [Firmicutes bacterium]|nr:protein arginine kinase [Bacillota bacterium]
MTLRDIIERTLSDWMKGTGPQSDVVLSSRIRVARNLSGVPFPHVASDRDLKKVLDDVLQAVRGSRDTQDFEILLLSDIPVLDRQVLVEKHLVSPQHITETKHRAVALSRDETVSIMVNEEDHIRIQTLFSGLQLEEAWQRASKVDDALEARLDYAFDETIGYLTACPTNVGTGMRASVMVHLPALAATGQVGRVLATISHVGVAVRGLYGEGTESSGNIYQLSNQVTLGRSEEDIIENLKGITRQVIEQENSARNFLLRERRKSLEDRVWRAYGILANARLMTSEEALKLISDVKLGVDTGIITVVGTRMLNELMVLTRPAYVQKLMGGELDPEERDTQRAALIRDRIKSVKEGK